MQHPEVQELLAKVHDEPPTALTGGPRTWIVARIALATVGISYAGYLALLITCDLWRVAPIGFVPVFETRGVIVDQLQADSIGARAGVLAGDVLRRANGQVLQGSADWQRVRVHLDPSKPLNLEIERHGESLVASLLLPSGLSEWQSGPAHPALLAFRFAQVITLVLAFVVAYKRHSHAPALLGAMLLGSLATVSLALPMRLAAFWHALPPILSALLWLPFAASAAVGPLLLAFFAVFPRPVLVADETRTGADTGGARPRLVFVRVASNPGGSRTTNGRRRLGNGRVRDQRDLRRVGGRRVAGAPAIGRDADGPAPHWRSVDGCDHRRRRRGRDRRRTLAQSGS